MPVYPDNRDAGKNQSMTMYADNACQNLAPVTDLSTGVPFPNSIIPVRADGSWPLFTSPLPALWTRFPGGIQRVRPNLIGSSALAVTGSVASGAAAKSLLTQLIALGFPLTDQTTA